MPKMQTNADMFAKMGNPWTGEKRVVPYVPAEVTDYDRAIDKIRSRHDKPSLAFAAEKRAGYESTENPELDQYFACKAEVHEEKRPEIGNDVDHGYAEKVAQTHLKYLKRKQSRKAPDIPEAPYKPVITATKPCKTKAAFSLWVKYDDGLEEELDRHGEKAGRKSFERYQSRKDTVEVELWSYDTGELLLRYERKPNV